MSFYPKRISEKFHHAKNVGEAANANAVGTSATFVCGAVLRFALRIDSETKTILDAKFKTSGCGYLVASAEWLAGKITGEKLTELHHFDKRVSEEAIENELGKFAASRTHCRDLALETLRSAFADFRRAQVKEWTGERVLICTCFGVSEETIENLVKSNSLATVEDVTDACRAGGGCGSCQPLIQDIIDVVWREEI